MTQRLAIKKMTVLRAATARHTPTVRKALSQAATQADSGLVGSASKYYVALKQLAKK